MSLPIDNDRVVSIHYTLTDADGAVIDSSDGKEPLNYLHGAGNIIPGLEAALTGKLPGDQLEVTVAPEEAYGLHDPQLLQTLPREAFGGIEHIEVGMVFQAQGPNGQVEQVTITVVDGDDITIDGNHALAGKALNFAVTVEAVREATAAELDHGHVH